jgi:hypothetical protein
MIDNTKYIWYDCRFPCKSFDLVLCRSVIPFIGDNADNISNYNFSIGDEVFSLQFFTAEEKLELIASEAGKIFPDAVIAPKDMPKLPDNVVSHCNKINRIICDAILDFYGENGTKVNYTVRLGYTIQLMTDVYKIAGITADHAKRWSMQNYEENLNTVGSMIPKEESDENAAIFLRFMLQKIGNQFEKNKTSLFGLIEKIWYNDYVSDFSQQLYREIERIKLDAETGVIEIKALKKTGNHAYYTQNVGMFFLKTVLNGICNKLGLYGADRLYLFYVLKEAIQDLFDSVETKTANNGKKQ